MRKVESVTIPAWPGNRDAGKIFQITEMPAAQAEKWALRAFLALNKSNVQIPMNVRGIGFVGIAILGLNIFLTGSIKPEEIEPLLDEMFTCLKIARDPKHPEIFSDIVSDDDIEEVATRGWLRSEVLRIHTGFSPADALSTLLSWVQASPEDSPST